jgi:signal peptidase II
MVWVLGTASAVLLVDQATKALAVRFLSAPSMGAPRSVFRLAANSAWWSGRSPTAPVLLALWTLAAGCTALVLAASPGPSHDHLASAGLVVALAGATSNLVDRLGRRAVVDFISIGRWPTFNLADVAIVVGIAVAAGSVV